MITEITINEYRQLKNIKVKLEPFTVLVGPNGSGKTAFLEYISLLHGVPVYYNRDLNSINAVITVIKSRIYNIILIDGIDKSLHPQTQTETIRRLRKKLQQNRNLQIITSTYSPYLIDEMQWNEVLVLGIDDYGYSNIKPITTHPDWEKWKDDMLPGEFWSLIGEDWVKNI